MLSWKLMDVELTKLQRVVAALSDHYGWPEPPAVTDPLGLILWENVAYLADDDRRARAYHLLMTTVGTSPQQIMDAPAESLLAVAKMGILPGPRVDRLRAVAHIALDEFGGSLDELIARPFAKAKQGLKKFPGIGEPGAEEILLFARRHPSLAPDLNALRVLVRLGYGKETSKYSATYRSALEAAHSEAPMEDYDWLIAAHLLMRRHGQMLCKRSMPLCDGCPVKETCAHFQSL
jgi:endonuclease III